jgi:tetratricopeptide (TPR) repeat protein
MRRRAPASLAGVMAVAAVWAGAVPPSAVAAAAGSESERTARQRFAEAERHFQAGLFADALAGYEAGYEASPLPGFLVNIAQCQRRLGELETARSTYRKFLVAAPDSPLVPEVKVIIAELDQALAETTSSATGGPSLAAPEPAAKRKTLGAAAPALAPDPATPPPGPRPSRTRWWLWGTLAAAAAGGAAAALVISSQPDSRTLHEGSLGTLRR